MGVISIVNGIYKPTYNWGGTTLYHPYFPCSPGPAIAETWMAFSGNGLIIGLTDGTTGHLKHQVSMDSAKIRRFGNYNVSELNDLPAVLSDHWAVCAKLHLGHVSCLPLKICPSPSEKYVLSSSPHHWSQDVLSQNFTLTVLPHHCCSRWRFPEMGGTPSDHPFLNGIFSMKSTTMWLGYPHFPSWKPPGGLPEQLP